MNSLSLALLFSYLSLCCCCCSSSSSSDISQLFETWCEEHGRTYASEEEKVYRLKVFEDNYDFVAKHNSKGNSSYTLSLNAFADLTHHEFKACRLGLSPSLAHGFDRRPNLQMPPDVLEDVPESIDWRKKGAVTPVKDQGSCGIASACLGF